MRNGLAGSTIIVGSASDTIGVSLAAVAGLAARDGGALASSFGLWRFDAAGLLLSGAAKLGASGETDGAELKKGRLSQFALAAWLLANRRYAIRPMPLKVLNTLSSIRDYSVFSEPTRIGVGPVTVYSLPDKDCHYF